MRFILVLFFAVSFTSGANALILSNENIPFYGPDFYNHVHQGDRDESLLADLRAVLQGKPQNPIGYTAARKAIFEKLFLVQDGGGYGVKEVYCGRVYAGADFTEGPQPSPTTLPSDKIMNVEHTWPQSRFTPKFPKDTQKCDLHHLFPSDSKLNGTRGNFWFGEVDQQKTALKCGASKLGSWNGKTMFFEPPMAHKGNVARALMYFSVRYNSPIAADEEALMKKWNHDDPVDADERARNDEIEKIQGNRNPFVDYPELADQISNFN